MKTCAIVDGVSSGRLLAAECSRRGFGVINELRDGRDPVALVERLLIACRD